MNCLRAGLLATLPLTTIFFAGVAIAAEVPTTILVLADGAAAVGKRCDEVQADIKSAKAALEGRTGPSTIAGDFAAYDALNALGQGAFGQFYLAMESHPDKGVREAAAGCVQAITAINTDIGLSRPIYSRLAAIPTSGLDRKTGYTLGKLLDAYRRAGVDKDEATRAKVTALTNETSEIGLKFAANIREDKGDIPLDPAELAGMPDDFLAARKPGADGRIHLTYDYPDIFPVLDFAQMRSTRRKVTSAFANRAWPANDAVLKSLLEKRYELATTLGYPDYATLITSDKMIGNPQRAERFLADIDAAARPGADAYFRELTAFAKAEDPTIERLERWDGSYFGNKLKKQKYDVDAAEVRQYFSYDKTQTGIFKLMGDLFGADIRPWEGKPWSADVSGWSLYDGERLVGHFYLDMHPREGKFNHAAAFPVQHGIDGKQVPIAALLCNFPKTGPMDHDDVVTFLHEFGHLIHWLYAGRQDYSLQNMDGLQWDFVEAPSQLLEEWAWDYDTLKSFASNDKGEPIPAALVERMNAGRWYGEAAAARRQIGFSAVSLNFYNRKPGFDLTQMYDEQMARYSPYPNIPNTHSYANFGHLDGYSAIYYTYSWSKAIATDLFSAFKQNGVRNKDVAMRYRTQILEAGATADAGELVNGFLGREWTLDAFREQLMQD
ncbi:M3 family metallopeptidase [Sphingopyxis granuli]|uniref:M3 family metallopeptidase n=1 Tax=Sphingopyxis granuli TaxID=267128 RepID=UPI001BAE9293|nr:M3 family metallopeptidase [Sphingopyxis granuli]QUM74022.1 Zn-dependent oligopeptidase [Sphingopyxis granuli]